MMEKQKLILQGEFVFKILYLISVLISFNGYFAGSEWISFFNYALVAFGGLLLLLRAVHFKSYIKTPCLFLLIAFVLSMCISSALNARYGFIQNLQSVTWTTLQFGLLYATDKERNIKEYKKQLKAMLAVLCGYVFLANLVSLGMFVFNYGVFGQYSPSGNIIGFVWGRLWGVYSDPNNGSVLATASVIISICAYKYYNKKAIRVFLIFNIILDYMYILASDSRTGMLTAFLGIALVLYLLIVKSEKIKLKGLLKNTACVLVAVIVSFSALAVTKAFEKGYNSIAIYINTNQSSDKSDLPIMTGRDSADTESDITNRRFDLWKSGIEIWETSPIYGVSQRNILPYTKENLPDTYLVNNDLGSFDSTHNLFLDVLASQGIIGIAIILLFFGCIAVMFIKRLSTDRNFAASLSEPFNAAIIGLLCVFSCTSMLVLDVLYLNSAETVLFWCTLGYLACLLQRK